MAQHTISNSQRNLLRSIQKRELRVVLVEYENSRLPASSYRVLEVGSSLHMSV